MKLKFITKKKEEGDATSYIFEPTEELNWTAGQFFIYFIPHENPDIKGMQRFFTISSAPFERHVMLTTRIFTEQRSSFKQTLELLKPGDLVEVKGPDGDFVLTEPNKQYIFIAGGIGITPFRSILKQLDYEGKDFTVELLYANKTPEFVFKEELEELQTRHLNFRINYVISPQHIDQNYVEQNVQNFKEKTFYVSGPEPMVENLYDMLKEMGIKDENLKTDYFPGYETF